MGPCCTFTMFVCPVSVPHPVVYAPVSSAHITWARLSPRWSLGVLSLLTKNVIPPAVTAGTRPTSEQFRRLGLVLGLTTPVAKFASMKWAAAAHMSRSDRVGSQATPLPPLAEARW